MWREVSRKSWKIGDLYPDYSIEGDPLEVIVMTDWQYSVESNVDFLESKRSEGASKGNTGWGDMSQTKCCI
jgi:hypothetical protein